MEERNGRRNGEKREGKWEMGEKKSGGRRKVRKKRRGKRKREGKRIDLEGKNI